MKQNVTDKASAHKFPVPANGNVAAHQAAVAQMPGVTRQAPHAPAIAKAHGRKPVMAPQPKLA